MKQHGMWLLVAVAVMGGCQREPAHNAEAGTAAVPAPETAPAPKALDLSDVIETNPRYVIGISYPPTAANYPGLAKELVSYANAAKAELMQAVETLGNDKPTAPYELSLSFEITAATPTMVTASADGSRYTGGAHGEPLVARFVWLPDREQALSAQQLVPSAEGWRAISQYVAGELAAQARARAQAEHLSPEDEQAVVRNTDKMIAEGTQAKAENFELFQPVLQAGRISAVRFVFPPYQVGPYSDGTQSVDVPAAVIAPHVAPDYAGLFTPL